MRINPFWALLPTLEKIGATDAFFAAVKEDFPQFVQEGLFESRAASAIYVCAIHTADNQALGILACASVHDYLNGAIKRHENTIPAKEEIQIRLWQEQQAMVKPVLLAYPAIPAIEAWTKATIAQTSPLLNIVFSTENQTYQIWEISDPKEIQYVQELFAAFVPRAFIADGHHRTSSAAVLYEQALPDQEIDPNFLVALFPSNQLRIQAFHRILDGVDWPLEVLLEKLSTYFLIEPLNEAVAPQQKFEICFLAENRAFRLIWRPEFLAHYHWEKALLDTQLFNEVVLLNVFGIENVRQEPRLSYVEGIKGMGFLKKEQQQKSRRVAFALYPIDLNEMMLLADHNQTLPPKSTWFEPRMKNGIVAMPYTI